MKTMLLFIMLTGVVFTTHAQTAKPTKEETIKFMANVLKSAEGNVVEEDELIGAYTVTKSYFDGNSYIQDGYYPNTKNDKQSEEISTDIKWESYDSLYFEKPIKNSSYTFISLLLKSKVTHIYHGKKEYDNGILIYIPNDKLPSFKKAILRLVEIAKEENKDPFGN